MPFEVTSDFTNARIQRASIFIMGVLVGGPVSPAVAADVFVGASYVYLFDVEDEDDDKHGFGIHAGVLFKVSETLEIGPEIGWADLGEEVTDQTSTGTGYDRWVETYATDLWHIIAVARIGKHGDGLRPFAQGGIGAYSFRTHDEIRYYNQGQEVPDLYFEQNGSDSGFGVNAGGGVRLAFGSSFEGILGGRLDLPIAVAPEDGVVTSPMVRVFSSVAYRF